jgi:hypothetical protein
MTRYILSMNSKQYSDRQNWNSDWTRNDIVNVILTPGLRTPTVLAADTVATSMLFLLLGSGRRRYSPRTRSPFPGLCGLIGQRWLSWKGVLEIKRELLIRVRFLSVFCRITRASYYGRGNNERRVNRKVNRVGRVNTVNRDFNITVTSACSNYNK